jgi:hypothetical protein
LLLSLISIGWSETGWGHDVILDDSSIEDALMLQTLTQSALEEAAKNQGALQPEKLAVLKNKIGPFAFLAARTKGFLEAKLKLIVFEYPDAIAFDFLMRFVKYAVLHPYLIASGHAAWLPVAEIIPEAAIATIPYLAVRVWLKQARLRRQIGMDPKLLKAKLIDGVDLNTTRLHLLTVNELAREASETLIIPVKNSGFLRFSDSSSVAEARSAHFVPVSTLERIVDRQFLMNLTKLNLDEVLYENALLQKVFSDRELTERFWAESGFVANRDRASESLRFFMQSELMLNRIRAEIENTLPEFSFAPKNLSLWIKGLWSKLSFSSKVNAFRLFQLQTLASAHKNEGRLPQDANPRMKEFREIFNDGVQQNKARFLCPKIF